MGNQNEPSYSLTVADLPVVATSSLVLTTNLYRMRMPYAKKNRPRYHIPLGSFGAAPSIRSPKTLASYAEFRLLTGAVASKFRLVDVESPLARLREHNEVL